MTIEVSKLTELLNAARQFLCSMKISKVRTKYTKNQPTWLKCFSRRSLNLSIKSNQFEVNRTHELPLNGDRLTGHIQQIPSIFAVYLCAIEKLEHSLKKALAAEQFRQFLTLWALEFKRTSERTICKQKLKLQRQPMNLLPGELYWDRFNWWWAYWTVPTGELI